LSDHADAARLLASTECLYEIEYHLAAATTVLGAAAADPGDGIVFHTTAGAFDAVGASNSRSATAIAALVEHEPDLATQALEALRTAAAHARTAWKLLTVD
jgi:hypothetical protein